MADSAQKLIRRAERHLKNREIPSAIECYKSVLDKFPGNRRARNGLDSIYQTRAETHTMTDSERQTLARLIQLCNEKNYEKTLDEINKLKGEILTNPLLINLKGLSYMGLGSYSDAVEVYERLISLDPNNLEGYCNLGITLRNLKMYEESIANLKRALKLKPDYTAALINLGNTYIDLGKPSAGIKYYEQAVNSDKNSVQAHFNMGVALYSMGNLKEASNSYKKALELNPSLYDASNNLGVIYIDEGKTTQAMECFRTAIKHNPNLAQAHRQLANIKKFSSKDADFILMENIYSSGDLNASQKMHLAFGLGKAYEDIGSYEEAFEHFQIGNNLRRKTLGYSTERNRTFFNRLKDVFSAELFARFKSEQVEVKAPIFILGMPRSGTTLLEQIVSSHSKVYGAGELNFTEATTTEYFTKISDENLGAILSESSVERFQECGATYLSRVRESIPETEYFSDKMPHNFLYLGMIKLVLPNSRILHIHRSPLDTCLSIYKNYFETNGNQFSYNLVELGTYYRLYEDLMNHWRQVLPGFLLDVEYETLVENQAEETQRILSFCDLEWEDQCLEFYKNSRKVQTASSQQVRQPMNTDSVERWRDYEKWIGPLIDVLKT